MKALSIEKVWLTAAAVFLVIMTSDAQKTTKNNYTGNWEANASWVGGTAAPTANIGGSSHLDLNIYGFIRRTGGLSFSGSPPNDSRNFVINDTLVVLGDVTFENKAANLRVGPNAVFIVIGNVTFENKLFIENGGIFVVSGNMNFEGGNGQTDYENAGGGELYVGGSVTGNHADPEATNDRQDFDELEDDYPIIHKFIECGGGPSCKLPVKLSYFVAEVQGESVALSWATLMEENFRKFVVQRSVDGVTFEDVADLNGKGRDIFSVETPYSYRDVSPFQGVSYYRLKAVDLDDTFEFFQVRMVRVEAPRNLGVYPNPSSGEEISFHVNFSPEESDRIVLIDPMGVELYNAPATSSANIVFAEKLKPGVYFLQYRSRQFEQVKRIVVSDLAARSR